MPLRGFCFFNSVAITAKLLQQKLSVGKVLIVDWVGSGLGPLGREGQRCGNEGLQKCPAYRQPATLLGGTRTQSLAS